MTEREEFEAWGKLNNFSVQRQPADEKFADYMSLNTERAWQSWQERARRAEDDEKDAARYRWLRNEGFDRPANMWVTTLPNQIPIVHTDLDAAIDAAILVANKEQK